jgi:hypothetical protein
MPVEATGQRASLLGNLALFRWRLDSHGVHGLLECDKKNARFSAGADHLVCAFAGAYAYEPAFTTDIGWPSKVTCHSPAVRIMRSAEVWECMGRVDLAGILGNTSAFSFVGSSCKTASPQPFGMKAGQLPHFNFASLAAIASAGSAASAARRYSTDE